MSLPEMDIIISKDGKKTTLESIEHSDQCFKLRDLAKKMGKVVEEDDKDHVPAFQDVNIKA
jgi:hypothetical protein